MKHHAFIVIGLATAFVSGCGANAPDRTAPQPSSASTAPSSTALTPMPSPSTSKPIKKPRNMAFGALKPGMCIIVPEEAEKEEGADEVEVVDCRVDHDAEVVLRGRIDLPDAWPSDQALDDHLSPRCEKAFASYVGIPYEESRLDYDYFTPVRAAWDDGDRGFNCVLFDPGAQVLTQAYRGSRE